MAIETTDLAAAKDEAMRASRSPAIRILDRVGRFATAAAVFGTPVERAGITVIPVARVRWGAGGGGGQGRTHRDGKDEDGQGSGGGGGATATPAGYIEIRDGEARFVRIPDPSALVPLVVAGGLSAWLTLRALRVLLR